MARNSKFRPQKIETAPHQKICHGPPLVASTLDRRLRPGNFPSIRRPSRRASPYTPPAPDRSPHPTPTHLQSAPHTRAHARTHTQKTTTFHFARSENTPTQRQESIRRRRKMAATALSVRPNRLPPGSPLPAAPARLPRAPLRPSGGRADPWGPGGGGVGVGGSSPQQPPPPPRRRRGGRAGGLLAARAGSRADDSAPFEMSVESALKLLGVPDTASFDEILRAKNSIVASCKDDKEAVAQVRAFAVPPTPLALELRCFLVSF